MFFRDSRGNVAIMTALAIVPLLAAAGAAIDYASAQRGHGKMQVAVDSAALAAVTVAPDRRHDVANQTYRRNLVQDSILRCAPNPTVTSVDRDVTVTARCEVSTSLMAVFGVSTVTLDASATATRPRDRGACLIALHSNDKEAVMINSDSAIVAPDCRLQINSSDSEALRGNSNGDITSQSTCLTGGYVRDNSSNFTPTPQSCAAVPDPLAALPVPSQATSPCNFNDLTVVGARTLNPGVYCGKTELNSGAVVTFNPGIYVIRNGEFVVNSGSRMRGDGVMLYLTGSNNARFNFNSGSHVQLKAPRTGTYAGIAIFQQRNSSADFSILNSDSTSSIEGVIYLPSTPLHLNSYGELSPNTPWTMVISSKLEVNSWSVLRLNADYDDSDVPVPALIEQANARMVRLSK